MKIHNIRLGFATNSSSSHSIIMLPESHPIPSDEDANGDFGWNFFTAASPEAKALYAEIMGGEGESGGYIDHQSRFRLVDRFTGADCTTSVLGRILAHPRVVVLGGNDNTDQEHWLASEGKPIPGLNAYGMTDVVVDGDVFTMFDRTTGNRVRFTLDGEPPIKGKWPDLVDVKITDFCPYGCTYCYQGSTPKGYHAPVELLERIAAQFKASGVFEVALGGGEPTLHPDFERIVRAFSDAGCVVNVTSRNVAFWRDRKFAGVGAVAFSIESADDIVKIREKLGEKHTPRQVHWQVVVGAVSDDEIGRIFEVAGWDRVTLLGYKDTGRGADARVGLPIVMAPAQDGWLRFKPKRIAIDTTLARSVGAELDALGVQRNTWDTTEGARSMYVDAVEEAIGPCSYAPQEMRPLDVDRIWEQFAQIEPMR